MYDAGTLLSIVAIQQKQIIVTCNYVARKQGLHKLQLLSEAKRACPELVVVNGENLDLFRDCSKENFLFLKEYIWGGRIERLGFDEVFMDVTDQIDYNISLAEKEGFKTGFYQLKPDQPNFGFKFEWDVIPGHCYPGTVAKPNGRLSQEVLDQIPRRLLLATHLAQYLRLLLLDQQGFTCSAGVCISKLTAKLAGTINKPCAQTLLLPDHIQEFLDGLAILKIPGIGAKTGRIIRDLVRRRKAAIELKEFANDTDSFRDDGLQTPGGRTGHIEASNEVSAVELAETGSPEQSGDDGFMTAYYQDSDVGTKVLESRTLLTRQILDEAIGNMPPGAGRIWELLHGLDNTEVVKASLIPTQVSIEDTFRAGTVTQDTSSDQLESILARLSITLIRRLKTDLLTTAVPLPDDAAQIDITQLDQPSKKWQAFPKVLRISTRDRITTKYGTRNSRSTQMPNFVFSLSTRIEETARRLAREALTPLLRKLHGPDIPGGSNYDLALINIAATNMGGGETGSEGGNVATMFKRYNEVFPEGDQEKKRPFSETQTERYPLQGYEDRTIDDVAKDGTGNEEKEIEEDMEDGFLSDHDSFCDVGSDEGSQEMVCRNCQIRLPLFAVGAHERFHKNLDGG
ncbi:hypothetical protein DRE_00016 [Drechslerella stenobrocha 248]|uniref:UmuC domain-containing protein n=1 Tax=Drechslerella stenobrocha 248 TaxID=1043628 RepID=W7HX09_9PEZI|nr:hypothetical protein DRE_00016 [Drechslerella stenobrocha 248]